MNRKQKRREKQSYLKPLYPWFGLFACLGAAFPIPYLCEAPWFDVSLKHLIFCAVLPAFLITLSRRFLPKASWVISVLILLGLGYAFWRLRFVLSDQAWAVNDRFLDDLPGPPVPDVTLLAGLLVAVWAVIVMILERTITGHIIVSMILLGVAVTMPLIQLEPGRGSGILWVLFFAGLLWIHGQKRKVASERFAKARNKKKGLDQTLVLLVSGTLILCFLLSTVLVSKKEQALYETVFTIDGRISRFLDRFDQSPFVVNEREGAVSRTNCYPSSQECLQVYADHAPSEDIYLRGFSGGDYQGGVWEKADEEEVYKEIAHRLGFQHSGTRMADMYANMYYMQTLRASSADQRFTLAVKRVGGRDLSYVPYYSRSHTQFLNENGEERNFGENTMILQYFEIRGLDIDARNEHTGYAQSGMSYQMLENLYKEKASALYTRIPEDSLFRMKELAAENPQEELNDITSFILDTLQERATYSLTPGRVPMNEDVSEYFLFENGKGYCEHFASAATLLYRLYGVPARYATGYRVTPDDFEHSTNGYWTARVTDGQAHAWVEIFLAGYGWVPVDVTPVGNHQPRASYPGYQTPYMTSEQEEAEQKAAEESSYEEVPIPDVAEVEHEIGQETEDSRTQDASRRIHIDLWPILRWILYIGIFAGCMALWHTFLRWMQERKSCRRLFGDLMDILYAMGLPKEVSEEREDLADQVAGYCPEIEMEKAIRIAEREAFAGKKGSREEHDFLLETVRYAGGKLYANASFPKQMYYRWIKGYA